MLKQSLYSETSGYLLGKTNCIDYKRQKVIAMTHLVTLETYLSLKT